MSFNGFGSKCTGCNEYAEWCSCWRDKPKTGPSSRQQPWTIPASREQPIPEWVDDPEEWFE